MYLKCCPISNFTSSFSYVVLDQTVTVPYCLNYALVTGNVWAETTGTDEALISPTIQKQRLTTLKKRLQTVRASFCSLMLHSALESKMKNGSGAGKAHFIAMVTSLACSSVVLGLRVSNRLNGCECKYSVVGQGVAGAASQGPSGCCCDRYDRSWCVKTSQYNLRKD